MSTNENDNLVISYLTMRKSVGWLGIMLPVLLLTGNFIFNFSGIFNNCYFVQLHDNYSYEAESSLKSSISHYYYTTVGEIFTGTLFAVALFLFCYKGHPLRKGDKGLSDSAMANLAGLFAVGVALFPTTSDSIISDNMRIFISSHIIGWIHYGFAALFFITLAFMSIINFRRTKDQKLFGTGPDDPFFLKCGIVMLACVFLIALHAVLVKITGFEIPYSTFTLETIALLTFGLSCLKKGRTDLMYVPKKLGLK